MLRFALASLLIVGSSVAEVTKTAPTNEAQPQYAEARDSNNWGSSSSFSDPSFSSSGFSSGFSKPVTYSTGHSLYSSDPSWSSYSEGNFVQGPSSFFGTDLISTGLNIVLGLFAFSLVMQIVSKVMASSLFEDIFGDARNLNSDDLVMYTNMAVNAFKKFEELNKVPK